MLKHKKVNNKMTHSDQARQDVRRPRHCRSEVTTGVSTDDTQSARGVDLTRGNGLVGLTVITHR